MNRVDDVREKEQVMGSVFLIIRKKIKYFLPQPKRDILEVKS